MLVRPNIIAIDGPAGSGKSVISQRLAEEYGYLFLDTGAFYRAMTFIILKHRIPMDDEVALSELLSQVQMKVQNMPDGTHILADGEDITPYLRSKTVESQVSQVSKIPMVRNFLLPMQRQVAEQGNIIMVGRDIGTVVLPHADLKLYIDASLEERAQRRYRQLMEQGKAVSLETVKAALAERDQVDSERTLSPLSQAADATYIFTDRRSLDEVLQQIRQIIDLEYVSGE